MTTSDQDLAMSVFTISTSIDRVILSKLDKYRVTPPKRMRWAHHEDLRTVHLIVEKDGKFDTSEGHFYWTLEIDPDKAAQEVIHWLRPDVLY